MLFPSSPVLQEDVRETECAEVVATTTLHHVLQDYHRTHQWRIKRHDAITNYVLRSIKAKFDQVLIEPHIMSENCGLQKPDLVACRNNSVLVLDTQVVGEQTDLGAAHERKAQKYAHLRPLLAEKYQTDKVQFTSITLSTRGLWSEKSLKEASNLGIVGAKDIKILSSRAIIGGLNCFHKFMKTTSCK